MTIINNTYDVAIVGGGIAGINAALTAARRGLKTVLFEERNLGGLSFNGGDLLMKKMYDAALSVKKAKKTANNYDIQVDITQITQEMHETRESYVGEFFDTHRHRENFKVIMARAEFLSNTQIRANDEIYTVKYIIIASGSQLRILESPHKAECFASGFLYKANDINKMTHTPKDLVVIGGGTIAFEIAILFALIGTKVTLLARDKFLTQLDDDLREAYLSLIKNDNLHLIDKAVVKDVMGRAVHYEKDGKMHRVSAEYAVIAIGFTKRVITIPGFDIAQDQNGIVVNNYAQTNIPNIYAIGNSNNQEPRSSVALIEGITAIDHMLGFKNPINYNNFTQTIIGEYQYGIYGKTEQKLKQEDIPYIVKTYAPDEIKRTERRLHFFKLLIHKYTLEVLGVHIIGENAVDQLNIILDSLQTSQASTYDKLYHFTNDAYIAGNLAKNTLSRLVHNIIDEDFVSFYQPKYNLETKTIVGVESLARFKVEGKFTNPLPFITAFENNGFIVDLDLQSLENACMLLMAMKDRGILHDDFTVSVNISPFTLSKTAVEKILATVKNFNIDPRNITLEITERNFETGITFIEELHKLREHGFKISMDDFSAGHSSLSLFNIFNFDEIKIDMGVLPKTADDVEAKDIYTSLVNVLRSQKATIVAEGIEEEFHLSFLKALGVHEGQGYYLARPMSRDDFIALYRH